MLSTAVILSSIFNIYIIVCAHPVILMEVEWGTNIETCLRQNKYKMTFEISVGLEHPLS